MEPEDIYTELLGVPPGPRPPNHYEILRLPLFEADKKIIHDAVLRQSATLKLWVLDPRRMDRIQDLLNEVNRAGFILEDPEYRPKYERELAARLGIPLPGRTPAVRQPPAPERPVAEESPSAFPRPMAEPAPAEAMPRRRPPVPPAEPEEEPVDEAEAPRGVLGTGRLIAGSILASVALLGLGFLLGRASAPGSAEVGPKETAQAMEERLASQQAKARAEAEAQRLAGELSGWKAEVNRLRTALKAAQAKSEQPPEPSAASPPPSKSGPPAASAEISKAAALKTGVAGQAVAVDLGGGGKLDLVRIPAGSFSMGSDKGSDSDKPVHTVTFAKPFYMGKYEVTQEQWEAVMGDNPSSFKGTKGPVERVSWDRCQEFLRKLKDRTGHAFALPTEAEWEYACRARSTTDFCFGDAEGGLGEYAWYSSNSGNATHPVGQKKPNAWGLYDMHGNVWEWCEDVFHNGYQGAPADGSAWLQGGDQGVRVLRGGSWGRNPRYCRSASRGRAAPWLEWGHPRFPGLPARLLSSV